VQYSGGECAEQWAGDAEQRVMIAAKDQEQPVGAEASRERDTRHRFDSEYGIEMR
jgi:hypothetical protein